MELKCHTIESRQIRCVLSPLGASLAEVYLKLPEGDRLVSLASDSLRWNTADPALAGRCVAPLCGRLPEGKCEIDGRTLYLTKNEGQNHLHGGFQAAQYRIWDLVSADDTHAEFALTLDAGTDGYPGLRNIRVRYGIQGSELTFEWHAETTEDTPFDLTNHVYWDLTGRFDGSAMNQTLTAKSNRAVYNNADHIPLGIVDTTGTCFDFSTGGSFAEKMLRDPDNAQLRNGRGFNNAIVFDGSVDLTLYSGDGISMRMIADRSCAVIYSGGFLDSNTRIPSGFAVPGAAIALEAESTPSLPHEILRPNAPMDHSIKWCFDFPSK